LLPKKKLNIEMPLSRYDFLLTVINKNK